MKINKNQSGFAHPLLILIPILLVIAGLITFTVLRIDKSKNNNSSETSTISEKKSDSTSSSNLNINQVNPADSKTTNSTTTNSKTNVATTTKTSSTSQSNPAPTPILNWTAVSFAKEATVSLPDGFRVESFGMDFVSLIKINMSALGITNMTKMPGTTATLKWNGWLDSYSSSSSSDSNTSGLQLVLTKYEGSSADFDSSFFSNGYSAITSDQGISGRKYIGSYANMERAIKYQFVKDSRLITIDYTCSKNDAQKCLSESEVDRLAKSVFFVI